MKRSFFVFDPNSTASNEWLLESTKGFLIFYSTLSFIVCEANTD